MTTIHWTTRYEGVANSFGYHVHDSRARQAVVAAGVGLDESSPVAFHVCPPHRLQPVPGKLNIAYVAWESSDLAQLFRRTLAPAHAICVTARFLQRPFQEMFPDKPVHVVHLGIDSETFSYVDRTQARHRPNFRPASRGGRPFRFLWVGAPNSRKGALHVLEAWRAFAARRGCELYIKTSLGSDSKVHRGLRREGNIIYDDRRLPLADLVRLYQKAHAFVFPSAGEGFGLTLPEAMATGLPAIYTPATAMLDIAPPDAGLGYPVKFDWEVQDWSWPDADARGTSMEVKARVASADTFDLARQMLHVMSHYRQALARGARGAAHIRAKFTWAGCGKLLKEIIQTAHQSLANTKSAAHEQICQTPRRRLGAAME